MPRKPTRRPSEANPPATPLDAPSEVTRSVSEGMPELPTPHSPLPTEHRSHRVHDLGNGLELWKVHLDDLREQTKNARTMDPATFKRLVANIESGQRLEQLPFVAAIPDDKGKCQDATGRPVRLELISGHHRTRAARSAKVLEVFALVDVSGLTRSQLVSKQLSHNAISGKDDQDMLAQLFCEMTDLEDMIASAIDPHELQIAQHLEDVPITNIQVDFAGKVLALTFLPTQLADYHLLLDILPPSDAMAVLPPEMYDRFNKLLGNVGERCDIRSPGTIFAKMLDIVFDWLEAQPDEPEPSPDVTRSVSEGEKKTIREAKRTLKNRRPATNALAAFAKALEESKSKA